jgi:hypothetical protein
MKTKLNLTWPLVLATFLLAALQQAAAWYSPSQQRWLNREPLSSRVGGYPASSGGQFDLHLYDFVENSPTKFVDRDGLFKWYGKWGGPNWTGGCEASWEEVVDQGLETEPPIDKQDECYEAHDKCHAACRDEFRKAPPEKWQSAKLRLGKCLRKCDRDLSKCLGDLGNDPSNNCHAKTAKVVFCVLGIFGHSFSSDPPPR